jgi:hypothetical protein
MGVRLEPKRRHRVVKAIGHRSSSASVKELLRFGLVDSAIAESERMLGMSPSVTTLLHRGRTDEAIALSEKMVGLSPSRWR